MVLATNITLSPLALLSIYGSYWLGTWILGGKALKWTEFQSLDIETLQQLGVSYLLGSFALAILLAIIVIPFTYFFLGIFRKDN